MFHYCPCVEDCHIFSIINTWINVILNLTPVLICRNVILYFINILFWRNIISWSDTILCLTMILLCRNVTTLSCDMGFIFIHSTKFEKFELQNRNRNSVDKTQNQGIQQGLPKGTPSHNNSVTGLINPKFRVYYSNPNIQGMPQELPKGIPSHNNRVTGLIEPKFRVCYSNPNIQSMPQGLPKGVGDP